MGGWGYRWEWLELLCGWVGLQVGVVRAAACVGEQCSG